MGQIAQNKDDVLESLKEIRHRLRRLGVKRLGLFGSFVRDEQGPTSDVDVLVEFEDGKKTFDHFMQVSFLLEDVLKRRVEIVTPESLSPHIGPHILKEVQYVSLAA